MHHVPWEIKRKTWKFIGLAFYANITDLFETCSLSFNLNCSRQIQFFL